MSFPFQPEKERKKNFFCWSSYEDEYLRALEELRLFSGQIGVHSSEDQSHVIVAPWVAPLSISDWFTARCGEAGLSASLSVQRLRTACLLGQ